MGTIVKGILGGFSGIVGTVTGSRWKGIDCIRSLPVSGNTDPTPGQLQQRAKFKTLTAFLRPMSLLIRQAWRGVARAGITSMNAAFAYNFQKALSGTYPAYTIDYAEAQLTNGSLTNVSAASCVADPGSVVKFSWTNNTGINAAAADDKVAVVVYCPSAGDAIFDTTRLRSDGTANVDATNFSGKEVHCWISCLSKDNQKAAVSRYLGQLIVT